MSIKGQSRNSQDRVLGEIKRLADHLFANLPASVYLYGSRARGDATAYSDWDLLIVTDDSLSSTHDAFEKYAYPFIETGWRLGANIIPLIYTGSEWKAESGTAFYLNVTNEAIRL